MASIPSMKSLKKIFCDEEAAFKFLQDKKIIKRKIDCPTCGRCFGKQRFYYRWRRHRRGNRRSQDGWMEVQQGTPGLKFNLTQLL
ncbi:Hypothetical protein SRAE_1000348700 [Strongyloides ratti]|uniref:Zinc finger, C2H2 domain-containing protein n=1 Tax=Strongyloides ratti TaxID=34506 RepID=A0A090MXD3_STRRB|nr:Hypothetical protein SRAE_1000348700 [Strongyloides ratti]CEF65234.1 Hypothetical protein SRAE_1000348700 [Strongyloides ratti]